MPYPQRNRLLEGRTFVPTDIAGLKLWLKADGTLWQDSARTTAATADSDPVGAWDDASGSGNHLTQATSANRPTLKLSVQNGRAGIQFDGVNDALLKLAALFSSGDFAYYVVFKETAANDRLLIQGNVDGGVIALYSDATPKIVVILDNSTPFTGTTTLANGTVYLAEMVYINANNPKTTLYLNAVSEATQNNAAIYSADRTLLGRNAASTAFMTGHIFEVLAYNATLSAGNQTSIRSCLNSRWAIY